MRALKIVGAVIGAAVAVIALLLVIGIPSTFLTAQIQERVERETGYRLVINGGARIGLWPSLNITLNDVALQNQHDRDINRRFAAASVEAEVTLASMWAGKPHVIELVIIRPVVNLPLRREREREITPPAKPAAGKPADAFSIEHISVTGGTIVFSNVRDRVENRIETVNADISIDPYRKVVMTGSARRGGYPL
jgi:AsmA protein